MKVIIFGAGGMGKIALTYFGRNRVEFFVDNKMGGQTLRGKRVLSFKQLCEINSDQYIIAVASESYKQEMVDQLENNRIYNYFCFDSQELMNMQWYQPGYWYFGRYIHPTYTEILSHYELSKYKTIGVVFDNETIRYGQYLLIELLARNCECDLKIYLDSKKNTEKRLCAWNIEKSLDSISNNDLVILNVFQKNSDIRLWMDDSKTEVADLFDADDIVDEFYHPELAKYKDIHKGERCFVIGTGPSLRIDDLDTLKRNGEICIGCNKIYRVYDKTDWRADYYGFLDGRVIEDCIEDLHNIPGEVFLGDSYNYDINLKIDGVQYFHYKDESFFPNYPRFSIDFTKGFFCGNTTTYSFGLQLAAYMGFSKIYLLGVDHQVIGNCTAKENHFIPDYYRRGEEEKYKTAEYQREKISRAYEAAEVYSHKYGFRIFNATRGGSLETFERVDFDSLF